MPWPLTTQSSSIDKVLSMMGESPKQKQELTHMEPCVIGRPTEQQRDWSRRSNNL